MIWLISLKLAALHDRAYFSTLRELFSGVSLPIQPQSGSPGEQSNDTTIISELARPPFGRHGECRMGAEYAQRRD